jgi:hypothetical protein
MRTPTKKQKDEHRGRLRRRSQRRTVKAATEPLLLAATATPESPARSDAGAGQTVAAPKAARQLLLINRTIAFVGLVIGISVSAWYAYYSDHLILVYNDAMSHLNISRLVIDNQQPGFAQLGSVWLPLNHVLALPLIWNHWAWQSGFAGSLVSMVAFVVTVIAVFGIVWELTGKRLPAFVAAAAAALNVNFLYLQSTPLTEPLFVGLFTASAYCLVKYMKTSREQYLVPLAFLALLQVLTRYDGWFVAAATAVVLLAYERLQMRRTWWQTIGQTVLFVVPVAFGCLLWFGWNAVIFGDPLYFATGPYSAHAQQQVIKQSAGLVAQHHLLLSAKIFAYTVADNIGRLVLVVSLAGWAAFLSFRNRSQAGLRLAVFVLLISAVVFNVIALFLGFSILNIPEMNRGATDITQTLFNVRYGIVALPFAAVGAGLLVYRWRYAAIVVAAAIVVQGAVMMAEKPITLQDGLVGASAFRHDDIGKELRKDVGPDQTVLVSLNNEFMPIVFDSGIPLKHVVHEGARKQWEGAIANPQGHAQWIMMSDDASDTLHQGLVVKHRNDFLNYYSLQYKQGDICLYRLKTLTAYNQ